MLRELLFKSFAKNLPSLVNMQRRELKLYSLEMQIV